MQSFVIYIIRIKEYNMYFYSHTRFFSKWRTNNELIKLPMFD